MPALNLNKSNQSEITRLLKDDVWVIACLCAAWCDVCMAYRPGFDQLAEQHPEMVFLWIDIEDHADLVGDLEIENFPTLLLQRSDNVAFFGPLQPDIGIARRLIAAYAKKSETELADEAVSSATRRSWQEECNLRTRLA